MPQPDLGLTPEAARLTWVHRDRRGIEVTGTQKLTGAFLLVATAVGFELEWFWLFAAGVIFLVGWGLATFTSAPKR